MAETTATSVFSPGRRSQSSLRRPLRRWYRRVRPSSDVSGRTLHDELDGAGPWRHGRLLVFRKDSELPPVCVKSSPRKSVKRSPQVARIQV